MGRPAKPISKKAAGPVPSLFYIPLFLGVFFVYLRTLCPAFMDDDSPETITAGFTLGLQHPPNYPLAALLDRLAALVPLGGAAFRINILTALVASLGVCLLALNAHRLLGTGLGKEALPGRACSLAGALLLAFSRTYWQEALGAKGGIYMVEMALLLLLFHFLIREESGRGKTGPWIPLGFFLAGIGFANDWPTQFIFLPALLLFLFVRGGSRLPALSAKLWASCAAFGLLGISPLLYLPLRAHLHPVLNLGAPDNCGLLRKYVDFREPSLWGAFVGILKGTSTWGRFGELARLIFDLQSSQIPVHLAEDMPAGALVLGLLGIFAWRNSGARRTLMVALVSLACLFLAFCVALLMPADPHMRWYVHNYLLPSNWIVALLAALGLGALNRVLQGRMGSAFFTLLLITLPAQQFFSNFQRNDQSLQMLRYDYGANLLKSAPEGAVLFAEGDEDYFPLYFFQEIERKRPDVVLVPSFTLFEDWGVEQVERLHPSLGLDIPAGNFPGPIDRLEAAATEIVRKNLARSPVAFTCVDGAFHRYVLAQNPSLEFRRSGLLLEFDTPLAAKGPWLGTDQLRLRHLQDSPTNSHDSLRGILQIYGLLGAKP